MGGAGVLPGEELTQEDDSLLACGCQGGFEASVGFKVSQCQRAWWKDWRKDSVKGFRELHG